MVINDHNALTRVASSSSKPRGDTSKTTSPRFIPPEITDQIIAAVAGVQRQTLLSCSLVCRNWAPASRFHLFNWVSIGRKRYDLFVDRVLHSEHMRPWLAHIHVLSIDDCGPVSPTEPIANHDVIGSPRSQRFVHDFAGHLPNLLELWLSHADWARTPPHPSAHILLSGFQSVRRLVLEDCHFSSFASVRRILAALPRLDDLRLSDVEWLGVHTADSHCIPRCLRPSRPSLVVLTTYASSSKTCTACLLRWLADCTRTRHSLRAVEFYDDEWTEWHFEFLHTVARSLTSLEEPTLKDFQKLLTGDFIALKKLGLLLQAEDEWAKLASLLEQLHAPLLQHIVLYNVPLLSSPATIDDQLHVVDNGLELLEPVFEGENMKRLERVEFVVYHERRDLDGDRGRVSALERRLLSAIGSKLPKFHERSKLTVRCQCHDPESVQSADDVLEAQVHET